MKCNMDCFNCSYPDCINDGRQSFTEKMMLAASCVDSAAHKCKVLEPKKQVRRNYYREHIEHFREYSRRYYRTHKDIITASEERRAYSKKYYQEHREEIINKNKEHQKRARAAMLIIDDFMEWLNTEIEELKTAPKNMRNSAALSEAIKIRQKMCDMDKKERCESGRD